MTKRIITVIVIVGAAIAIVLSFGTVDRGIMYEIEWLPGPSLGPHSVHIVVDRIGEERVSASALDMRGKERVRHPVMYSQFSRPRVYAIAANSNGVVAVAACEGHRDSFSANKASGTLRCERVGGGDAAAN